VASYDLLHWEDILRKTFITARNVIGVAGLILAGYVLITSIPDLGRYVKMSTM
jgi:hypothetical protein